MKIIFFYLLIGLLPLPSLIYLCNAQYFVNGSYGLNYAAAHVLQRTDRGKYFHSPYTKSPNLALRIGRKIGYWEIETGIEYSSFWLNAYIYTKRPDICSECDMGGHLTSGYVSWNVPVFLSRFGYYKKWQYGGGVGGNILNYNTAKPYTRGWGSDDYTFALTKSQNYNGLKPNLLAGITVGYMLNQRHQFNIHLFYNYGLSKIMNMDYRLDLHYNGINETYYYKTSYKGDYIGLRLSYRYLFNLKF